MKNIRTSTLIALIFVFALLRLVPAEPNFTPIGALALFAGYYFANRWTAFMVPLAALFVSDMFLGFYSSMSFVYGAFALTILVGMAGRQIFKNNSPFLTSSIGGLIASLLFFVVTNFGVWVLDGLYAQTAEGLALCYTMAIPFFRATLVSTLIYSFAFFAAMSVLDSAVFMPKAQES